LSKKYFIDKKIFYFDNKNSKLNYFDEKDNLNIQLFESNDLREFDNYIIIYDYENCRGVDLLLGDNLYIVITISNILDYNTFWQSIYRVRNLKSNNHNFLFLHNNLNDSLEQINQSILLNYSNYCSIVYDKIKYESSKIMFYEY
jgi:hypothetical protein